VLRKFY